MKLRINECIKESGYKKKYVAEQLGITARTLSRWIMGESSPTFDQLVKLATVLDCEFEDLYEKEGEG